MSYCTWVSKVSYRTQAGFFRVLPYVSKFSQCLTLSGWVFPLSNCTRVNFASDFTVRDWVSLMFYVTWVGFQIVLLHVSEFPLCLTLHVWVSPVPYRTWVSFPSVLPYVIEFPLGLTVREWVSPVRYHTCVSPVYSVRTWVCFSSVLPYVNDFPLCVTVRVWVPQCLSVRV